MKWLKKLLEPKRETETKPDANEQTRKEALRIKQLEARLAPTAIWGE